MSTHTMIDDFNGLISDDAKLIIKAARDILDAKPIQLEGRMMWDNESMSVIQLKDRT